MRMVDIEQGNLPAVRPGLAAKVTADAYGDRVFDGTVEQINPVGDATSRVFATRIRVANGPHLLQPGMFVKVEITTGTPVEVIAVPQNAGGQQCRPLLRLRGRRRQGETPAGTDRPGDGTDGGNNIRPGGGQKVVLTDVDTLQDQDQVTITASE